MLVFVAFALVVGLYFYFDTKQRQAVKTAARQTVTKTITAPRVLTTAEIQASDAKNQAYAKKLDDDYYRKEISVGILQLNDIAERFNDLNRIAAAAYQIARPQFIQQMQGLRREAAAITPHQCLRPAAASMVSSIAEMVNGYLSFMQSSDATANRLTKRLSGISG